MKTATNIIKDTILFQQNHPALSTGFPSIDCHEDFLYIGKLTLLAGRPSMGKTLFALSLAARVASQGSKAVYITANESAEIITKRLMKAEGLQNNAMDRIYVDDTAYGVFGMREMVEAIHRSCPDAKLIVLDGLEMSSVQWLSDAFSNAAVLVLADAGSEAKNSVIKVEDIDHIEDLWPYFTSIFSVYRDDYYSFDEPNNILRLYNIKSRSSNYSYSFYADRYSVKEIQTDEEEGDIWEECEDELPYHDEGSCGESLFWRYEEGILKIYGTGAMENYDYKTKNYAPWFYLRDEIEKVVVDEGITSIGCCAFYHLFNCSSVSIPASVKTVEAYAFSHADSLISAGPLGGGYDYEYAWEDEIPAFAFSGLYGLKQLIIKDDIKKLGRSAASWCTSLEEVQLPESLEEIQENAFGHCYSLSEVPIPKDCIVAADSFNNTLLEEE